MGKCKRFGGAISSERLNELLSQGRTPSLTQPADPYLPKSQQVQDALGCDSPTAFLLLKKENEWAFPPLQEATKNNVAVERLQFVQAGKEALAIITLKPTAASRKGAQARAEVKLGKYGSLHANVTVRQPTTEAANYYFQAAFASLRAAAERLKERAILNMYIPAPNKATDPR